QILILTFYYIRNMKVLKLLAFGVIFMITSSFNKSQDHAIALVIHGGAGTVIKENMTPELEKAYHDKMNEALEAGYSILKSGGSSLDAVEAVIRILEDS